MAEDTKSNTDEAAPQQLAAGESAQPAPEAPAEAPKRRRGRPRKADVEAAKAAAAGEAATGEGEAAPEPPKRRRGRPRKADVEAPQAAAAAAVQAELPLGGDAPAAPQEAPAEAAPEPPKRRRGRPRKADVEAAQAEAAAAPAPEAPAEEPRPSIEEMTRVTQQATQATALPMGAPATTLAEADAQSSEQEAQSQGNAQTRRRRRNGSDGAQDQQNGKQGQNNQQNQNNRRNNQNRRRNRRNQQEQSAEPSLTREALAELKVAELRSKAAELGVPYVGMRKKDLADAIYEAAAQAEGFRPVSGVLEIQNEGYGFLRTGNYMAGENDAFVHQQVIRQYGLRVGDKITGTLAPARSGNKYPPLHHIDSVNGRSPEEMRGRPRFRDLTPIFPNDRLVMENGKDSITGRAIDLVAPIGKGQRGLIVSPPKAGKTTVLKRICQSIAANNPEVHLFCLLVDERPEEVTDMERSIRGEVVASTFDMPADNHTKVSELVIEHAKRLVELGEDVVVVLDSITRLARAYNLAQPASGRILSGGVDSAALYPPKKFLGAARNIEFGGSLTILASALVDTGSKMDEVIFEEFKGTGNMELKLDRDLADKRIFPAIDPVASGTRNEDLLIEPELQPFVWGIRRVLANMNNTERAANALVKGLKSTKDNQEFLIRSARKAQQAEIMV